MPHLINPIGHGGPLIDVLIGVSQPRHDYLKTQNLPVPPPIAVRGLIDTGASCTCVDPNILQSLHIQPTGIVPISTPSTGATPHLCNQYDVGFFVTHTSGPLYVQSVAVVESQLASQGIQALVGRDILSKCLLIYDGENGYFTLAF